MTRDIITLDWHDCVKCHASLERWNTGSGKIYFCPSCGKKLLKKQSDRLWHECSDEEIADIIQDKVLSMLPYVNGVNESELAVKAWEYEVVSGDFSGSAFNTNTFILRHKKWVKEALHVLYGTSDEDKYFAIMEADCNDAFLIKAFIQATHHYLHGQLSIYKNKRITEKRAKEIRRMVKAYRYDGGF